MMCFYGYHINVDESNLMVVFKASDLTQKPFTLINYNVRMYSLSPYGCSDIYFTHSSSRKIKSVSDLKI